MDSGVDSGVGSVRNCGVDSGAFSVGDSEVDSVVDCGVDCGVDSALASWVLCVVDSVADTGMDVEMDSCENTAAPLREGKTRFRPRRLLGAPMGARGGGFRVERAIVAVLGV